MHSEEDTPPPLSLLPSLSRMNLYEMLSFLILLPAVSSLSCLNCKGWSGSGYTPRFTTVSDCDNLNNACNTVNFCVKIVNPIEKGRDYVTYTSQCWNQINLQQTPTNLVTISNKVCYNYTDGAVPPTRYYYCFCNDRDYCNEGQRTAVIPLLLLVLAFLLTF